MFIGASPFVLIWENQNQFIGGAPIFLGLLFPISNKKVYTTEIHPDAALDAELPLAYDQPVVFHAHDSAVLRVALLPLFDPSNVPSAPAPIPRG
jgi:hypothetical protein